MILRPNPPNSDFSQPDPTVNENDILNLELESEYEKSDAEIGDDACCMTIGDKRKQRRSEYIEYDPFCDHKLIEWKAGLCFENPSQMHEAVQRYAIANGYNLRWKRSNASRQEAICVGGCPWKCVGAWLKKENTFVIRDVFNQHKCSRSLKNRQATTKWLAKKLMEGSIRRAGATAREIQQQVMEQHHLEVPLMKVYKACWESDKMVNGSIEDHFKDLRPYLDALRLKYPSSTFKLACDLTLSTGTYTTFKRIFVCFDALRSGFIEGCRPFIGFDGTFIKHKCGGILLSAVGRDGNEGMFPIAWAVVEGENTDSWTWFLEILFQILVVANGAGWTFISDQHKGLLNAIGNLAPAAEHRNCARHIYMNWKARHKGLFLKSCFYKIVKSTNEVDYAIALKEMRGGRDGFPGSVEAADDFVKQGPQHFCKAFFSTSSKCGTITNNMCETFNSYIVAARRLPLIDMLERIRRLLMVRQCEKRKIVDRNHDILCPKVRKEVEELKESVGRYVVKPSLAEKFEVSLANNEKDRYLVDFIVGACSCRFWDLNPLPCSHAIACIHYMKRSVEEYVHLSVKMQSYKTAYSHVLEPLDGVKFWPRQNSEVIRPPPYKKLPGRPKKQKRKISKEEEPKESSQTIAASKLSRRGTCMKCSVCGVFGHNKRTCKGEGSSQQASTPVETNEGRAMRMTCRNCGGKGHNKRTCKVTPLPSTAIAEDVSVDRSQESVVSPQARKKQAVRRGLGRSGRGNLTRSGRGNNTRSGRGS